MFLPPYIFAKLGWGGGVYGCFFCVHRASAYRPFFFTLPALHMYIHVCPGIKHVPANILETALVQAGKRMRPAAVVFPVGSLLF